MDQFSLPRRHALALPPIGRRHSFTSFGIVFRAVTIFVCALAIFILVSRAARAQPHTSAAGYADGLRA